MTHSSDTRRWQGGASVPESAEAGCRGEAVASEHHAVLEAGDPVADADGEHESRRQRESRPSVDRQLMPSLLATLVAEQELGDMKNWAASIESDLRLISSSLEYAYKVGNAVRTSSS